MVQISSTLLFSIFHLENWFNENASAFIDLPRMSICKVQNKLAIPWKILEHQLPGTNRRPTGISPRPTPSLAFQLLSMKHVFLVNMEKQAIYKGIAVRGRFESLRPKVNFQITLFSCHSLTVRVYQVFQFLEYGVDLCQPSKIHICDGSDEENRSIMDLLVEDKMVEPLPKYENWYYFYHQFSLKMCCSIRNSRWFNKSSSIDLVVHLSLQTLWSVLCNTSTIWW